MPKPFSLEAAKAGAQLVTRDGKPAKFVAHVPEASDAHKVICLLGCSVFHFYENGVSFQYSESPSDLFLADPPKVKKSGWVNVYPTHSKKYGELATCQDVYSSFDEALRYSSPHKIATVEITWEEEAV